MDENILQSETPSGRLLSDVKLLWLQQKQGSFGGAEANVLATATALRDQVFHNTLLYRESTGLAEENWIKAFGERILAPHGEELVSLVEKLRPDAIWIHNWDTSEDFARLRVLGIPMGRMVHDHALYCMRHYKYHPLTRKNCARPASLACLFPCGAFLQRGHGRWPIRIASLGEKLKEIHHNQQLDRLLVASAFMQQELVRNRFPATKIHLLPPVPPPANEEAQGKCTASLPYPTHDFVPGRILYIGQVIRGKGVDYLLKALHGLPGDWHLSLAGQGSALPACRKLIARLGLENRITLYGHLSQEAVRQQYREAQFIVVPSAWPEPFGMVGIEAMRESRAVIGFGVGGIPEWLKNEENGVLVPPADIHALREAMAGLLADRVKCRRLGARGYEMSHQEFSFARYIEGLVNFLQELKNCTPFVGARVSL